MNNLDYDNLDYDIWMTDKCKEAYTVEEFDEFAMVVLKQMEEDQEGFIPQEWGEDTRYDNISTPVYFSQKEGRPIVFAFPIISSVTKKHTFLFALEGEEDVANLGKLSDKLDRKTLESN